EETPEDALKAAVTASFGAHSTQEFYDRLKRVKLTKLSQTQLVTYVARFRELVTTNTEYGDDKTIVEIFVDNLGSDRLSDRVRSEVDTAGKHKDLKYAMKQAFEELREMLLMKTEVMRHAAAFGLDIRELKPTGRKRRFSGEKQPGQPSPAGHRSQTERKPIRCFNCGKVGHKASECPFRKANPKSQDKKSMKARVALNKESSKFIVIGLSHS
ncbi:hypothetical protein ADUPG1_009998, partial [Aduncisulcus paluster]